VKDTTKGPRYSIIPSRAVYDPRLTPRALRVLCALGVHSDNDGWCFPDQATIARDLGMSRPRVSTAIVLLTELGYVACELRVQKGKGMRGLWYRVILDTPGKPPVDEPTRASAGVTEREHRRTREQNEEGDPVLPNGNTGAGVTKRCAPVLPNGNTYYKDEQSQLNDTPLSPPQAGDARGRKTRKAKASKRGKVERSPPGFDDAWALWTKLGSSRAASMKAWRAHRATGAVKLAAVKLYLASKQAQSENGRFVPYMQRWLNGSLGSFVEAAKRAEKARSEMAAKPEMVLEWDPKTRTAKQVPKPMAKAPSQ